MYLCTSLTICIWIYKALYCTGYKYISGKMFSSLNTLTFTLLLHCSEAIRLHQAVRPGCTVGIIADGSELGDRARLVEKFLQLDLHDKVVYASGEEARKKKVGFLVLCTTSRLNFNLLNYLLCLGFLGYVALHIVI